MNSKIYDEWLRINVELNNKLENLKEIDKEREIIINEAKENELSDELKEKMNINISKYNALLEEIKIINIKAKDLNEKI